MSAGRSAATAARSGSALVVGIVGLTLGALGIGTVYLPFIADKDKLRGMNEESEASAIGQLEYERAIREMSMMKGGGSGSGTGGAGDTDPNVRQPPNAASSSQQQQQQQQPPRSSNNMWERLNQAARSPSKRAGKD
jgi:hypothetical protein